MILQSIVRRTSDQFAAGAPLTTIFAEHVAGLAEAGALWQAAVWANSARSSRDRGA
jgi:hypothetical protein